MAPLGRIATCWNGIDTQPVPRGATMTRSQRAAISALTVIVAITSFSCGEDSSSNADVSGDCMSTLLQARDSGRRANELIQAYFDTDPNDGSYVAEQETYSALYDHMSSIDSGILTAIEECQLHNPDIAYKSTRSLEIAFQTWFGIEELCLDHMPLIAPQFDCG